MKTPASASASASDPQNTVIRGSHVLQHSYVFVENFNTSPSEFYGLVEASLKERKVPGLEANRIAWNEGGPLSCKREYLRLSRERLAFDICAASFGTGYFFSCRFTYNPAPISLVAILGILFAGAIGLRLFVGQFGFFWGPLLLLCLFIAALWTARNATEIGLSELDEKLINAPFLSGIYERLLRRETYYRIDTRIMYRETVPAVFEEVIDQVTGSKGMRLASNSSKPRLPEIVPETVTS